MSNDSADPSKPLLGYPIGVERALARAAADPAFLSVLKERRAVAAQEAGINLTPSEQAVLAAISEQQLEAAVALLVGRDIVEPTAPRGVALSAGIRPELSRGIRPGLPIAVATGAIVVGGAGALLLVSAGNRPDLPPATAPSSPPTSAASGAADPQQPDAATADAGDEDADGSGGEQPAR